MTYDELADEGVFAKILGKTTTALIKLAAGELGRKMIQAQEKSMSQGRNICALQLLRIIHEDFQVNSLYGALNSIEDLQAVKLVNDKNLETF